MDYTILLGTWLVAISGPCVISWLAGDMAGSARVRRLYAGEPDLSGAAQGAAAFRVEPWRIEGAVHPLATAAPYADAAFGAGQAQAMSFDEQAERAERRRKARLAMPDPVRADAGTAPLSILIRSEPAQRDSQRVPDLYRSSLQSLRSIQSEPQPGDPQPGDPQPGAPQPGHNLRGPHALPSVRIAAPVRWNDNSRPWTNHSPEF